MSAPQLYQYPEGTFIILHKCYMPDQYFAHMYLDRVSMDGCIVVYTVPPAKIATEFSKFKYRSTVYLCIIRMDKINDTRRPFKIGSSDAYQEFIT